jgi:hypothetical protein
MHLVPGKLDLVMVYLCHAFLTTVRLEMSKRQIDAIARFFDREFYCFIINFHYFTEETANIRRFIKLDAYSMP